MGYNAYGIWVCATEDCAVYVAVRFCFLFFHLFCFWWYGLFSLLWGKKIFSGGAVFFHIILFIMIVAVVLNCFIIDEFGGNSMT